MAAELGARAPAESAPLRESDLAPLPAPVRRYLAYAGALGHPRPSSMRAVLTAEMFRKPGTAPIPSNVEQHDFFDEPVRVFFMRARMFGLPVRILHDYGRGEASMLVRVLDLFSMVDVHGPELFQAETVTMLNDMAIMAPATLADPRLGWRAIDDHHAEVTFANHGCTVRAVLVFNDRDELVNFVSDDRLALGDDGVLRNFRFSTPLRAYRRYGAFLLASEGDAVWHYPEGEFVYGRFVLDSVDYDVVPR